MPSWPTRKFLTTNLERSADGKWSWQINLPAIQTGCTVLITNDVREAFRTPVEWRETARQVHELGWRSVSIYHGPRHQPLVRLDEKAEALLRHVGATHVHITLSHSETVAMAVAALVRA